MKKREYQAFVDESDSEPLTQIHPFAATLTLQNWRQCHASVRAQR